MGECTPFFADRFLRSLNTDILHFAAGSPKESFLKLVRVRNFLLLARPIKYERKELQVNCQDSVTAIYRLGKDPEQRIPIMWQQLHIHEKFTDELEEKDLTRSFINDLVRINTILSSYGI